MFNKREIMVFEINKISKNAEFNKIFGAIWRLDRVFLANIPFLSPQMWFKSVSVKMNASIKNSPKKNLDE